MNVRDLVQALLARDALTARQWVADAESANFDWTSVRRPEGLAAAALAVAAGVTELLSSRAGQTAPAWTSKVAAAPEPVFLVAAAATLPRLRRTCETDGPEPLRRRRVFAPPDFLTIA